MRRFNYLLVASVAIVFFVTYLAISSSAAGRTYIPTSQIWGTSTSTSPKDSQDDAKDLFLDNVWTRIQLEKQVRVAITEVTGTHDEVSAALINTFGAQPNVKLELYQHAQRYGIKSILDKFELSYPLADFAPFQQLMAHEDVPEPHILVSTTCELDSIQLKEQFDTLLARGNTYLFCVVHHADRWNGTEQQRNIMPWVKKGMVDMVSLSEHTAKFLEKEAIPYWNVPAGVNVTIRTIVPVFPVESNNARGANEDLSFALQGDYDPLRRDYNRIFEHLESFLAAKKERTPETSPNVKSSEPNITLHLIGHNTAGWRPPVPEPLQANVVFDDSVDYPVFYGILSRTFALLPAFASDTYYDRKASSSVPASLISGTPLIATRRMLETYNYLREEDIWLQNDTESDFDVVGRVLALGPKERQAKKDKVVQRRNAIIQENKAAAARWIESALGKIRDPPAVQ